eukprot:CAMPEP_0178437044 /NCGR_PEP_ID=MMETSP0689_2-20121128/34760_1 /TAXON_ID=160604 /ORGANISM="Amphidinium massartii, Strain CS-259" /LENGTH=983 /DNA_ID=CAMNT_0020059175 /DNA_START=77 /DNA_END=3024 /DNA_ORIENTATION=+
MIIDIDDENHPEGGGTAALSPSSETHYEKPVFYHPHRRQSIGRTGATGSGMMDDVIQSLKVLERHLRHDIETLRVEMHKRFDKGSVSPCPRNSGSMILEPASQNGWQSGSGGGVRAEQIWPETPTHTDAGGADGIHCTTSQGGDIQFKMVHYEDTEEESRETKQRRCSEDWPQNVRFREHLKSDAGRDLVTKASAALTQQWTQESFQLLMRSSKAHQGSMLGHQQSWRHRIVLHPDHLCRWVFDTVSIAVLLTDAVYTPYSLSFGAAGDDASDTSFGLLMFFAIFWTLDLVLSFNTGFQMSNGAIELRFYHVALNYLRTTFAFDALCVAMDIITLLQVLASDGRQPGGAAKVLRIAKLQRVLRFFRLARIERAWKRVNTFMEAKVSQSWHMIVLICQLSLLLLWLCHMIACAWYSIGRWTAKGQVDQGWLSHAMDIDAAGNQIHDQEGHYRYIVAFHWSLGQISLGGSDIAPYTAWERMFTIGVNLFGLIFGGALVSILSSSLIELRAYNQERNYKLTVVREFLVEKDVALGVRLSVLDQIKERLNTRGRGLVESDVTALQVLSQALLKELRWSVYSPLLSTHPLLHMWGALDADTLRALCTQGPIASRFLHDDELFSSGEESEHAYYVVDGSLTYIQDPPDEIVDARTSGEAGPEVVAQGTWISQATLWCHWIHVGQTIGTEVGSVLCLPPEALFSAMSGHQAVEVLTREYARCFHASLTNPPQGVLPNDLRVPFTDFQDVLRSMSQEAQVAISLSALAEYITNQRQWKLEAMHSMSSFVSEIRDGRSMLVYDADGSLWRSVAVDCIEIQNIDGQILVEVMDSKHTADEGWRTSWHLPGKKRASGETFHTSIQEVLHTHMSILKDALGGYTVSKHNERKPSESFGTSIGTDYTKSVCLVNHSSVIDDRLQRVRWDFSSRRMESSRSIAGSRSIRASNVKKLQRVGASALGTTLTSPEQCLAELHRITNFYLLSGSTHKGLYA